MPYSRGGRSVAQHNFLRYGKSDMCAGDCSPLSLTSRLPRCPYHYHAGQPDTGQSRLSEESASSLHQACHEALGQLITIEVLADENHLAAALLPLLPRLAL